MLEFKGDAICLSGVTGTKLKSEIISEYYPFWWKIVSGGERLNYRLTTAIIELYAATGEVYIKDTDEVLLGSAGHALKTKYDDPERARNLRLFFIEENEECFQHLQNVLHKRWKLPNNLAMNTDLQKKHKVYVFNLSIEEAIQKLEEFRFRNGLYFFDPLLYVEWSKIEKVARSRIRFPFKTGTEFIIFVFTSDWFQGRGDFAALPNNINKKSWSEKEKASVLAGDEMFGKDDWKKHLLVNNDNKEKEKLLVEFYKKRLLKWFRYVLPLPFKPKSSQLYHLFFCSNYEDGIRATRNFYYNITDNPKFAPDNVSTFLKFKEIHPELFENISGKKRPDEWKCLWQIIRNHEDGYCDIGSRNLEKNCSKNLLEVVNWLHQNNYLILCKDLESAWKKEWDFPRYKLNWRLVKKRLGVEPPQALIPVTKIKSKKSKR